MAISLPSSVKIPRESLLETLGAGISTGLQNSFNQFTKSQKFNRDTILRNKLALQKKADSFGKDLEAAAKETNLAESLTSLDPTLRFKMNLEGRQRILAGETPESVLSESLIKLAPQLQAYQDTQKALENTLVRDEKGEEVPLSEHLKRGLRESAAGSVAGAQYSPEELQKMAKERPSFGKEMAQQAATLISDLPLMGLGASFGGPIAALALPELVKSTADEIYSGMRSKDKFTLRKGGEAAARVAERTVKGAFTGALLKKVPGLIPALKRLPGGEKLLKNAFTSKLLEIGGTTAALAVGPSALEGKLPTQKDFVNAMAITLGAETLRWPSSIKKNLQERAVKTKLSPDEFATKVKERAQKEDIDLEKAAVGQGKELQKLNRVVNTIGKEETIPEVEKVEKVAEKAPKAEIGKEQLKERKKLERQAVRRAAKSPLEEYFEIPREVERRPETILKEEARLADVEKREIKTREQLKEANNKVLDLESEARRVEGARKSAVERQLENAKEIRERYQNELRDLRHERKYKRRPPTMAEISDQIDKSFKKIKEEIRKPKEIDEKKVKVQAERDQKAIETADKLLKRGNLLNSQEEDTFMRIKRQYRDSYKDMIDYNKELIEENKKRSTTESAKKMNEELSNRLKRIEADITRQKDKRAIQQLSKGARGSFFKNELKKLRSDIADFQKQFFKQKKLKDALEFKTEVVGKHAFEEMRKLGSEVVKNPTEENLEKASKETGTNKKELKSVVNEMGEKIDKLFKRGKEKRIPSEKEVNKTISDILKNWAKKKLTPRRISTALIQGVLFEIAQRQIEKIIGKRLPFTFLTFFIGRKPGTAAVAQGLRMSLDKISDTIASRKIQKASDLIERQKIINELREKGISSKRLNKILKEVRAA